MLLEGHAGDVGQCVPLSIAGSYRGFQCWECAHCSSTLWRKIRTTAGSPRLTQGGRLFRKNSLCCPKIWLPSSVFLVLRFDTLQLMNPAMSHSSQFYPIARWRRSDRYGLWSALFLHWVCCLSRKRVSSCGVLCCRVLTGHCNILFRSSWSTFSRDSRFCVVKKVLDFLVVDRTEGYGHSFRQVHLLYWLPPYCFIVVSVSRFSRWLLLRLGASM